MSGSAPPHINSLADLKGKRVGISDFNSIRHWAIQIQLKKAGLDLERDVEWVRIGVAHHLLKNAIRSGRVECAPVPTWDAEDLKKEGCNVLVSPARSISQRAAGKNHRRDGAYIWRKDRPWSKAFSRAIIRAYWFVRDMPKNHEYVTNLEKRLRFLSPI